MCGSQKVLDTDELISKTETDTQTQTTDLWLPRGWSERGEPGVWDLQMQSIIYKKWINKKVLYSTENSIQSPVIKKRKRVRQRMHG